MSLSIKDFSRLPLYPIITNVPSKNRRISSEENTISEKQAKKMLSKVKKNIIDYFDSFKSKENKDYFEYLQKVQVQPSKKMVQIVRVPVSKRGDYQNYSINFLCPMHATLHFQGLVVRQIRVDVRFPQILLGENFMLPQIDVSVQTYKPWYGNFGLAWPGSTGDKKKFSFHPYQSRLKRMAEIREYYADDIVDPLCDLLNNYDAPGPNLLRKSIAKFIKGKTEQFWRYQSVFDKSRENVIPLPIECIHSETANKSVAFFRFYCVGDNWPVLSDILFNFLEPISTATSYFDDAGELMSQEEIDRLMAELEKVHDREKAEKKVKEFKREKTGPWNPFEQDTKLKRDEFGFLMDARRDDSEFGTKDFTAARKEVIKTGMEQQRKLQQAESSQDKPDPQDVSRWGTARNWYNDMQMKKFNVVGGTAGLSFTEKGELNQIQSCDPPFMLRFARDEIRLKGNMVGIKVIKMLFKYYKRGYLRLA